MIFSSEGIVLAQRTVNHKQLEVEHFKEGSLEKDEIFHRPTFNSYIFKHLVVFLVVYVAFRLDKINQSL